jgi:hypothetical protein
VQFGPSLGCRGVAVVGIIDGGGRAVQFGAQRGCRGVTCVGRIGGYCRAVQLGASIGCRGVGNGYHRWWRARCSIQGSAREL